MATKLRGEQLDISDVINDIESGLDTLYLRQDGTVSMSGTLTLGGVLNTNNNRIEDTDGDVYIDMSFGGADTDNLYMKADGTLFTESEGVTIKTWDKTGSDNSGNITIQPGQTQNGNGGDLRLYGSWATGSGQDGNITMFTDAYVRIQNHDFAAANATPLQFREASSNGTNLIELKAPDAVTNDRTWTLPQDDPATVNGQFLTTDASGNLSFAAAGSGPLIFVAYGGGTAQSILGTVRTDITGMVIDFTEIGRYRFEAYIPVTFNTAPSTPNEFAVNWVNGGLGSTPQGDFLYELFDVGNNSISDIKNDDSLIGETLLSLPTPNTNNHIIRVTGTYRVSSLTTGIQRLQLQMSRNGSSGSILVGGEAHMMATKIAN